MESLEDSKRPSGLKGEVMSMAQELATLADTVFDEPPLSKSEVRLLKTVASGSIAHYKQRSAKKLMQHRADGGYDRRQIPPKVGGDAHGIPLA